MGVQRNRRKVDAHKSDVLSSALYGFEFYKVILGEVYHPHGMLVNSDDGLQDKFYGRCVLLCCG